MYGNGRCKVSSYLAVSHVVERSKLPAFQHFGMRFLYPAVVNRYETVTNSIRHLSSLCNSYQSYPTVISSMSQLLTLCDSDRSFPTIITMMINTLIF